MNETPIETTGKLRRERLRPYQVVKGESVADAARRAQSEPRLCVLREVPV